MMLLLAWLQRDSGHDRVVEEAAPNPVIVVAKDPPMVVPLEAAAPNPVDAGPPDPKGLEV